MNQLFCILLIVLYLSFGKVLSSSDDEFFMTEEWNFFAEAFDPRAEFKTQVCEILASEERDEVSLKYFTKSVMDSFCRLDLNDPSDKSLNRVFEVSVDFYNGPEWNALKEESDAWDQLINKVIINALPSHDLSLYIQNHLISSYPMLNEVNFSININSDSDIDELVDFTVLYIFYQRLSELGRSENSAATELEYQQLLDSARYSTWEECFELKYHVVFLKNLKLANFKVNSMPTLEEHKSIAPFIAELASLQYDSDPELGEDTLALFYSYPFRVANHSSYEEFIAFCRDIQVNFPEMSHTVGSKTFKFNFFEEIDFHEEKKQNHPKLQESVDFVLSIARTPKFQSVFLMCSPYFDYRVDISLEEELYRSATYMTVKMLNDLYPREIASTVAPTNFKVNGVLLEELIRFQHTRTLEYIFSRYQLNQDTWTFYKCTTLAMNVALKHFAYAPFRILKRKLIGNFICKQNFLQKCVLTCAQENDINFARFLFKTTPTPESLITEAAIKAAYEFSEDFVFMVLDEGFIADLADIAEIMKSAMIAENRSVVQLIYELFPTLPDSLLDFLFDDDDLMITDNMVDYVLMKPNLSEETVRAFGVMFEQDEFADFPNLLEYLKARRPGVFSQNKRRKLK